MVLCVAGDVDPERICALAREILSEKAGPIAAKDYGPKEEDRVAKDVVEQTMEVAQPIFQLGFKGDDPGRGEKNLRQQLVGELALECLLGNSTPLYARLYGQGLINSGFYYGYESYPGVAFLVAGGESKDPAAVRQAVWDEAARIGREGIDPALWRRVKKGVYGGKVRGLNSFDSLCIGQARAFFAGYCSLDFARLFDVVTKEEAEDMIVRWKVRARTALSVIRPKEN